MFWRKRTEDYSDGVHGPLSRLVASLGDHCREEFKTLQGFAGDQAELDALYRALLQTGRVRARLLQMVSRRPEKTPDTAADLVQELGNEVLKILHAEPWEHHRARGVLLGTLHRLTVAARELAPLVANHQEPPTRRMILPADLLYQGYFSLFPAERMLVAAGRKHKETMILGAVFDVTGDGGVAHVQADPQKLGQALIAMERSGTHLAFWLHSHPGSGPEATRPSAVDRTQHQDWLRDYSPALLSGIMVADGWLRLWGTALERGTIAVDVMGSSITKEKRDDTLYRLANE